MEADFSTFQRDDVPGTVCWPNPGGGTVQIVGGSDLTTWRNPVNRETEIVFYIGAGEVREVAGEKKIVDRVTHVRVTFPPRSEVKLPRFLDQDIQREKCTANGCARPMSCQDARHATRTSEREIVGGLGPYLVRAGGVTPAVHPSITTHPATAPTLSLAQRLALRAQVPQ